MTEINSLKPATISRPLPSLQPLLADLKLWLRQSKERRQLAHMSHRELADIGITRSERVREVEKPFWQD